jgi:hypothetical protein
MKEGWIQGTHYGRICSQWDPKFHAADVCTEDVTVKDSYTMKAGFCHLPGQIWFISCTSKYEKSVPEIYVKAEKFMSFEVADL